LNYQLRKFSDRLKGRVQLESSKSESNRALLIKALAGGAGKLSNLSTARDTQTMLLLLNSPCDMLDVKDAGTTMRFLTAYLAVKGEGQILTGTDRMKKRPIGPLVDALREIGAHIEYLGESGCPPIKVHKINDQKSNIIRIPGNISSQYISALLMIAPCLQSGLTIELTTEVFSKPYIHLTLDLMSRFGITVEWNKQKLKVKPQAYRFASHTIEGDWSGAGYWYSFIALSQGGHLILPGVRGYSSQGDKKISRIMYDMGVASHFEYEKVKLIKKVEKSDSLFLDFRDCPDLAQTVMVVAAVSGITLNMTGLESLRIKETDRIRAMKNELSKIGAVLLESSHKWILRPGSKLPDSIEVETYEDHRMAMAFAPLCQLMDVTIKNPMVVEKSYPGYWNEIERLGVKIEKIL